MDFVLSFSFSAFDKQDGWVGGIMMVSLHDEFGGFFSFLAFDKQDGWVEDNTMVSYTMSSEHSFRFFGI